MTDRTPIDVMPVDAVASAPTLAAPDPPLEPSASASHAPKLEVKLSSPKKKIQEVPPASLPSSTGTRGVPKTFSFFHPSTEMIFQSLDDFSDVVSNAINFHGVQLAPIDAPMGFTGAIRLVFCRNLILTTQKWATAYTWIPKHHEVQLLDMPISLWRLIASFAPTVRQPEHPDVVADPKYIETQCNEYLIENGLNPQVVFLTEKISAVNTAFSTTMRNALAKNIFTTEIPSSYPSLLTAGPVSTGRALDTIHMSVCSVNHLDLTSEQFAACFALSTWEEQKVHDDVLYVMKDDTTKNRIVRTTSAQSVTTNQHRLDSWKNSISDFFSEFIH
jgi:hypothetical protein